MDGFLSIFRGGLRGIVHATGSGSGFLEAGERGEEGKKSGGGTGIGVK